MLVALMTPDGVQGMIIEESEAIRFCKLYPEWTWKRIEGPSPEPVFTDEIPTTRLRIKKLP
jgi:hypothetical protein